MLLALTIVKATVEQKKGFLLIDCSISILIVSLMLCLYSHWAAHYATCLYQSKLRIEGLFLVKNSIELILAGLEITKEETNHFKVSVVKKFDHQFCWVTVCALPKKQENILPISMIVGFSISRGAV